MHRLLKMDLLGASTYVVVVACVRASAAISGVSWAFLGRVATTKERQLWTALRAFSVRSPTPFGKRTRNRPPLDRHFSQVGLAHASANADTLGEVFFFRMVQSCRD